MDHAISHNNLENVPFGLEDVYLESETLSGIKAWFREPLPRVSMSRQVLGPCQNIDEMNVSFLTTIHLPRAYRTRSVNAFLLLILEVRNL